MMGKLAIFENTGHRALCPSTSPIADETGSRRTLAELLAITHTLEDFASTEQVQQFGHAVMARTGG